MRTVSLSFAILVSYLGLTGCATNQLMRLEAQDAAMNVTSAAQAGHAFYVDLVQRDELLNGTLYALDPSCKPGNVAASTEGRIIPKWLEDICTGNRYVLTHKALNADHAAIDFVAEYAALLTELALAEEDEDRFTFAQALSDYDTFAAAVKANPIGDERKKALEDLGAWLHELQKDRQSAAAIRREFEKSGDSVQKAIVVLARNFSADAGLLSTTEELLAKISDDAMRGGIVPESFRYQLASHANQVAYMRWQHDRRVEACNNSPIADIAKENDVQGACLSLAGSLMVLAAHAHGEFASLMVGNLNERQRRRKAMLAYRNFVKAISVLTGIRDAR